MYVLHCTMYLAAAVGGDRWGRWAVLQGRRAVGMELERGVPCVLRVLEVMVSEYLGLLEIGLCSYEKSASCVSSSSQLQWSHGEKQGKQRGQ